MKSAWLWPLSWYWRIKVLEAENAALRQEVKKITEQLRAEAIANTVHNTAMASMFTATLSNMQEDYRRARQIGGSKPCVPKG